MATRRKSSSSRGGSRTTRGRTTTTRSRSASRNGSTRGAQDALAILKADHVTVKQMLLKLESGRGAKESLLRQIENELKVHTQIEEEIFYPAFEESVRTRDDKQMYYEAIEEHHVVDMVLSEITDANPRSEEFEAKAKVLKDLIEHHVEEEETRMFAKARKFVGAARLRELGVELMERKQELMSGMRFGGRRRAA